MPLLFPSSAHTSRPTPRAKHFYAKTPRLPSNAKRGQAKFLTAQFLTNALLVVTRLFNFVYFFYICKLNYLFLFVFFIIFILFCFFILYHPRAAEKFYPVKAKYHSNAVARPYLFFYYFIILFHLMLYIDYIIGETHLGLAAEQTRHRAIAFFLYNVTEHTVSARTR